MSAWSKRRINRILDLSGGDKYLEIGVEYGDTFVEIQANLRVGVDIKFQFDLDRTNETNFQLIELPSDLAFRELTDQDYSFDFVFLDGLHQYEQTYRDLLNSLDLLEPKGFILIDDVFPVDTFSYLKDQEQCLIQRAESGDGFHDAWHGDIFKVIAILHDFHNNLNWVTFSDQGNPQTLVWFDSFSSRKPLFKDLGSINSLTYAQVLDGQHILNWRSEAEVFSMVRELFT